VSNLDRLQKGVLDGKGTEPSVPPPLGPASTPDDVLDAAARMIGWKVFCSRMPNGTIIGDAWFDDYRSEAGFDEVRALEMPGSDFLMFRQFGILRPSDRPVDMALLQAAIERQGGE
jgi:hypothetical protein